MIESESLVFVEKKQNEEYSNYSTFVFKYSDDGERYLRGEIHSTVYTYENLCELRERKKKGILSSFMVEDIDSIFHNDLNTDNYTIIELSFGKINYAIDLNTPDIERYNDDCFEFIQHAASKMVDYVLHAFCEIGGSYEVKNPIFLFRLLNTSYVQKPCAAAICDKNFTCINDYVGYENSTAWLYTGNGNGLRIYEKICGYMIETINSRLKWVFNRGDNKDA